MPPEPYHRASVPSGETDPGAEDAPSSLPGPAGDRWGTVGDRWGTADDQGQAGGADPAGREDQASGADPAGREDLAGVDDPAGHDPAGRYGAAGGDHPAGDGDPAGGEDHTGGGGQGAVIGQPGPRGGAHDRPPSGFQRARLRWRWWRRSRPFWGGLLLILAGLELLAIPLLSLLVHSAVKIVIYIGIGGVFGVLFGGLLIACGLLAWFHPAQRIFYAVVGVLLALGSFIVTNLGGFFLGMLLGVIGASLVFGWTPQPSGQGRRGRRRAPREPQEPDDGLDAVLGKHQPSGGQSRNRLLALPLAPLLLAGLAAPAQAPAAAAQGSCLIPLLSFLCPSSATSAASTAAAPAPATASASATPSATSTASPSASPDPSASPAADATPSPGGPVASGSPAPAPSASKSANPNAGKQATAMPSLLAAAVPATLTAGSALMEGLAYDGVASVPTANGSQQMLKFSMSSLHLGGGIQLSVTAGGHTMVTRNTSVTFSGNVVLYATRLCGDLLGIRLCFTPQSPPPLVLPVMSFTNVLTEQPLTSADSLAAPGLDITG